MGNITKAHSVLVEENEDLMRILENVIEKEKSLKKDIEDAQNKLKRSKTDFIFYGALVCIILLVSLLVHHLIQKGQNL